MSLTYRMREAEQKQGLTDLCNLVKSYIGDSNLKMVEVGSYCGASGEIIASSFPNSILNCVDPWERYTEEGSVYDLDRQELELKEAEGIFDSVMAKHPNMRKNKMPSIKYAENLQPESIDFIYIDGNHQYSSVVEDLKTWYDKVKPGGVIAGHDYGWTSVNSALKDFFNEAPVSTFCDGSWFYFKQHK
jgi:predicted O-methyltransferase YrrM